MKFKTSIAVGLLFSSVIAFSAPGAAQGMDEVLKALDDALPGALIHNPLELSWESNGNDLKSKVVDAEALPSGKALRVRLKKKQNKPWDSTVGVEIDGAVEKGEEIEVRFWARTKKPAAGKETTNIVMFLGRNEEPYDNIISEDVLPGSDWKLLKVSGIAKADFPENSLKAEYQLGGASQTVEFGPIYVSTLGKPAQ